MNRPILLLLRAAGLPLGGAGAVLMALYLVSLMAVQGLRGGALSALPRDGHTLAESPPVALMLQTAGRYGDASLALPGLLVLAAVAALALRDRAGRRAQPHPPTASDAAANVAGWLFGVTLLLLGVGFLLAVTLVAAKPWGLPGVSAATCGVLGLGSLFAAGLLLELATWKQG